MKFRFTTKGATFIPDDALEFGIEVAVEVRELGIDGQWHWNWVGMYYTQEHALAAAQHYKNTYEVKEVDL